MNKVLEADFQYITEALVPWEKLNEKTVLITGGTGFLGSLLVRFFHYLNVKQNRGIKVIALVRNEEKAKRVIDDCGALFVKGDICDIPVISTDVNYIFHCAATTESKLMIEKPVEVLEGIVLGTNNIMKLAREKKPEGVLCLSSMEVYGSISPTTEKTCESDLGSIDILNARSCYPLGKRTAENICFSYFHEYGVPVKIARLAQTFGAGVPESDNRVFAQFARSVLNGEDIVLHTDGLSMGNYCYTADAILGLLFILFRGENGQAYNVVNEEASMTIKEMAEIVAEKVACGSISIKYDIPKENIYGYAAASKMKLSASKIKKLGWKPRYGMEDMYERMIRSMRLNHGDSEGRF